MSDGQVRGNEYVEGYRAWHRAAALQAQSHVVARVLEERRRQDEKWGEQNHGDLTWLAILVEEVGELGKACVPVGVGGAVDEANIEEEIEQLVAVGVAWLECRARNQRTGIDEADRAIRKGEE